MFDIGFFELSLIGVVALIVIGPDRLPGVARTAGKWLGRLNRFVSNIKEDINKEIRDEELKNILNEQQKLADEFKSVAEQTQSSINKINASNRVEDLLEITEDEDQQPTGSDNPGNTNVNTHKESANSNPDSKAEEKARNKKKKKKLEKKAKKNQTETVESTD